MPPAWILLFLDLFLVLFLVLFLDPIVRVWRRWFGV